MRPDALADAIAADRAAGILPIAVVATVGTTSTTSVDPVPAIADICAREQLWLHVDAAYAGVAAMLPTHAHILDGAEPRRLPRRQPAQVAVHAVRPERVLLPPDGRDAGAHSPSTPEFLRTTEGGPGSHVKNLMDTGVQLGRRFRALKLWMILRSFGARAIREHLAEHIRLAQAVRVVGGRACRISNGSRPCRSASSASDGTRRHAGCRRRSSTPPTSA